ncbi:hypothetical protein Hypma_005932, partial [Hypsizygus marmoreus]
QPSLAQTITSALLMKE